MDKIQDIVYKVFQNIAPDNASSSRNLQKIWGNAMDEKVTEHAKIDDFKNGEIFISVDSLKWLYQMNMMKGKILTQIKKDIPEAKNIFFKVKN